MGPLIDPFLDNGFMLRALIAGILVATGCAVVGTFVVLRGLALDRKSTRLNSSH